MVINFLRRGITAAIPTTIMRIILVISTTVVCITFVNNMTIVPIAWAVSVSNKPYKCKQPMKLKRVKMF